MFCDFQRETKRHTETKSLPLKCKMGGASFFFFFCFSGLGTRYLFLCKRKPDQNTAALVGVIGRVKVDP